jgi:hypothetical protein
MGLFPKESSHDEQRCHSQVGSSYEPAGHYGGMGRPCYTDVPGASRPAACFGTILSGKRSVRRDFDIRGSDGAGVGANEPGSGVKRACSGAPWRAPGRDAGPVHLHDAEGTRCLRVQAAAVSGLRPRLDGERPLRHRGAIAGGLDQGGRAGNAEGAAARPL